MNVGTVKAISIGAKRSIKCWRILAGVYIFNLVFAAVMALPFAGLLAKDISRSLAGRELLGGFSEKWCVSFLAANGEFIGSLFPQLILVAVMFVLVEIFFAGGLYSVLSREDKFKFAEFASTGSAKFLPVLAVTVIEALLLVFTYFGVGVNNRAFDFRLLAVVIFVLIGFVADFVKAAVVIDHDGFWTKAKHGIEFILRHPVSTFGLYLCCLSISAAVVSLYILFYGVNDSTTAVGVLNEMVASHIIILLRIFSRVIFYAGEAALYKENQIEVIKVKLEMLE